MSFRSSVVSIKCRFDQMSFDQVSFDQAPFDQLLFDQLSGHAPGRHDTLHLKKSIGSNGKLDFSFDLAFRYFSIEKLKLILKYPT